MFDLESKTFTEYHDYTSFGFYLCAYQVSTVNASPVPVMTLTQLSMPKPTAMGSEGQGSEVKGQRAECQGSEVKPPPPKHPKKLALLQLAEVDNLLLGTN